MVRIPSSTHIKGHPKKLMNKRCQPCLVKKRRKEKEEEREKEKNEEKNMRHIKEKRRSLLLCTFATTKIQGPYTLVVCMT